MPPWCRKSSFFGAKQLFLNFLEPRSINCWFLASTIVLTAWQQKATHLYIYTWKQWGLRSEDWGLTTASHLLGPHSSFLSLYSLWNQKNPQKLKKSSLAANQLTTTCATLSDTLNWTVFFLKNSICRSSKGMSVRNNKTRIAFLCRIQKIWQLCIVESRGISSYKQTHLRSQVTLKSVKLDKN